MTSIQSAQSPVYNQSQSRPIPPGKAESLRDINAILMSTSQTVSTSPAREWSVILRGKDQRGILSRMLDTNNFDVDDLEALEALSEAIKGKIEDVSPVHSPHKFVANLFTHRVDELREIEAKIEQIKDIQRIVSICRYLSLREDLLKTEGLFRVCSNSNEPHEWIEKNHNDLDALAKNVHNMTGALKQLVGKRLLMSDRFKDNFVSCVTEKGEINEEQAIQFREHLYEVNVCYRELFQLLNKISLLEECNKMTVENLRICMIPRLVSHPDPLITLELMNKWAPIIDWLIQHPEEDSSDVSALDSSE